VIPKGFREGVGEKGIALFTGCLKKRRKEKGRFSDWLDREKDCFAGVVNPSVTITGNRKNGHVIRSERGFLDSVSKIFSG